MTQEKQPFSQKPENNDAEEGAAPASGGKRKGSNGLPPTRYGDWELNGRCIDF